MTDDSMKENYVPVASFLTEIEAELSVATLASAGIESYLQFEDTGGMMPVLQQSEGVKLLVNERDFEEAKAVLSSEGAEESAT